MNAQLRQGQSTSGTVFFNWDGKNLRQGQSSSGTILLNWDVKYLRQGQSSSGSGIIQRQVWFGWWYISHCDISILNGGE